MKTSLVFAFAAAVLVPTAHAAPPAKPTMQQVLDASAPGDWRSLVPEDTLYLDLPAGRVVIELAPTFAPLHVANIRALVRAHYFDGLSILRVQDNYVTQWGDPFADEADKARSLGKVAATVATEAVANSIFSNHLREAPRPDGWA